MKPRVLNRRFFLGAIAALPAACVPTKPSYAKPPLFVMERAPKDTLNAVYGKLGRDWREVQGQLDRENLVIKAILP